MVASPSRKPSRMSWQDRTSVEKPVDVSRRRTFGGSSQQSAALLHSPPQALPVGSRPYFSRSQMPPLPAVRGIQVSPSAQSRTLWHDSPRWPSVGRGVGGTPPSLPPPTLV